MRTVSPTARKILLPLLLIFAFCAAAFAQADTRRDDAKELAAWIKANYTKYEYRIPMRDGVHLFTSVYIPKDASATNTYPIMFDRTPYSVAPYGVDNYPKLLGPSDIFTRSRYIFVYQDVRGKFMSEGTYEDMRPYIADKKSNADVDESSDTYDSVDWLVKNIPHNNGKVGIWGISYPGFYTALGMIDAHPAIKAVSPQAPIADWFIGDDFHHNGALWLPHMFGFMAVFGLPRPELTTKWTGDFKPGTPDGYNFYKQFEPLSNIDAKYYKHNIAWWDQMIQHPNYDAWWKARSTPQFLKNIKPAVLTVGGWFDAEDLWGALHTYEAANAQSPGGDVKLVMGPWCHGCWARTDGDHLGNVWFNAKTAVFYRERIEYPFFEYYLKDGRDPELPEAYVFETGTNQWRKYDSWPPADAKPAALYFGANGTLSLDPPKETKEAFDEYVSDPNKPVPYIAETSLGMAREYMDADQRNAGRRTDVLIYQTEPLDHDVTLAGPIKPELFVSTTGTDSDWVVKLIDVYPGDFPDTDKNPSDVKMGDYQQLVRGEPFRGRFRNGFDKPAPFTPGKVTRVEYVMPDVNHTFRKGHRIMVQVQSSWFPLVDINPQTFVPNIYDAKPADFKKATQHVYYGGADNSRVNVMVLSH